MTIILGEYELPERLQIEVAGHREHILYFSPERTGCGSIDDGVTLYNGPRGGAWVISFLDLERMYLAAKKARE